MYRVLIDFVDTDGVAYYKGDSYPFFGFGANKEHIEYLLSSNNKAKIPLIEEVTEREITGETLDEALGETLDEALGETLDEALGENEKDTKQRKGQNLKEVIVDGN